jgi:hypothetical protein
MRAIADLMTARSIKCRNRDKYARLLFLPQTRDVVTSQTRKRVVCGFTHRRVRIIRGVPQSRGSGGTVGSESGQVKGRMLPTGGISADQGTDERGYGTRACNLCIELHGKTGSRWVFPICHASVQFGQRGFCLSSQNYETELREPNVLNRSTKQPPTIGGTKVARHSFGMSMKRKFPFRGLVVGPLKQQGQSVGPNLSDRLGSLWVIPKSAGGFHAKLEPLSQLSPAMLRLAFLWENEQGNERRQAAPGQYPNGASLAHGALYC